MGGRYYLTGVQIGMLIGMIDEGMSKDALKLLEEIQDKQYICEKEDFKKLLKGGNKK